MGRRKGLAIDGVLLLDKPRGITSNAALQRARRALGAAKAGHTGTLDPMASGLLPVAFGEATKFSQYLLDADKIYLAEVRLGVTTNTGDAEGQVIATSDLCPSDSDIVEMCGRFLGEMDQMPPMYSALKRDGKALYEYARVGVEVKREARRITIHRFDVLDIWSRHLRCRVRCSKGTYIRTLAEDLGRALGCGAHLTALKREASGNFHIENAVPLEAFETLTQEARLGHLLPPDTFAGHLPILALDDDQASRISHGQAAQVPETERPGVFRLYQNERFIGLGTVDEAGHLTPLRLLAI
jgi:tRNA pseudouridine55 synthase